MLTQDLSDGEQVLLANMLLRMKDRASDYMEE
jgi:hypothetical protein